MLIISVRRKNLNYKYVAVSFSSNSYRNSHLSSNHPKRDPSPLFGNPSSTLDTLKSSNNISSYSQPLASSDVLSNLSNINKTANDENMATTTVNVNELQKELNETKDKLKIITQKFVTVRKERDQLK